MNSDDRMILATQAREGNPLMRALARAILDIDRELRRVIGKPTTPPDGTWSRKPDKRPEGLNDFDVIEERRIDQHDYRNIQSAKDTVWGGNYEYRIIMRQGQTPVWPGELVEKLKKVQSWGAVGSSNYMLLREVIDALTGAKGEGHGTSSTD
jgi:hypothetical protein